MKKRVLGKSGLEVSALGYGAMGLIHGLRRSDPQRRGHSARRPSRDRQGRSEDPNPRRAST